MNSKPPSLIVVNHCPSPLTPSFSLNSKAGIASLCALACAASLGVAQAESDDFDDGNDAGWSHYNPLENFGVPGVFSFAGAGPGHATFAGSGRGFVPAFAPARCQLPGFEPFGSGESPLRSGRTSSVGRDAGGCATKLTTSPPSSLRAKIEASLLRWPIMSDVSCSQKSKARSSSALKVNRLKPGQSGIISCASRQTCASPSGICPARQSNFLAETNRINEWRQTS